jgi:hypothetical protein
MMQPKTPHTPSRRAARRLTLVVAWPQAMALLLTLLHTHLRQFGNHNSEHFAVSSSHTRQANGLMPDMFTGQMGIPKVSVRAVR